jgi:hypothetical protein
MFPVHKFLPIELLTLHQSVELRKFFILAHNLLFKRGDTSEELENRGRIGHAICA